MSEEKKNSLATQQKYSRYKSARHILQLNPVATLEKRTEQDVSRTKSMSRYRRPNGTVTKLEQPGIPETPVPAIHSSMLRANTVAVRKQPPASGHPARIGVPRRLTDPVAASQSHYENDENPSAQNHLRLQETEDERMRRKVKQFQDREGLNKSAEENENTQQSRKAATERAPIEAEPRRNAPQQSDAAQSLAEKELTTQLRAVESDADQTRRIEEENANILAEHKRKDLERLQRELDAAVFHPHVPKLQSVTSPLKGKFSLFSRKKKSKSTPPLPQTSKGFGLKASPDIMSAENPRMMGKAGQVDAPKEVKRPNDVEKHMQITQGGGGIVPQTDVPMSASNAGERRVLIRCKQSSINLPITTETTPADIIYSAANIMTQDIDPSTAVLVEAYTQLGLDRRIRRYEHVRDIMNSWDRDTQNSFVLQNSDSPKFDTDLEISSAGTEVPSDVTVYMYHSQKPGKWNERYITLLSSGQIYMSKRPGTKPSEKDAVNLCHMSDFDIYTPTPQQIRKTLKPPKRHCHAIKSQQKTTVFLSTENFVHFFSSEDEPLATKWYFAVQRWRSWYLVNRMGEGRKRSAKKDEQRTGETKVPSHASLPSVDATPYTIGSFVPLFQTKRPSSSEHSDDHNRQAPFHLSSSVPQSPESEKHNSRRHPPPVLYQVSSNQEPEFASAGLLGHTYSTRQRELQQRDNNPNQNDGRTFSMASTKSKRMTTAGDGLARKSSQRSKPKPLLDFTPTFKEAPQWDKSGKGRGVAPVNGLPLVETATTPATGTDDIPKSTVFRREEPSRPRTAVRPKTGKGGTGGDGFVEGGLLSQLGSRGERERERERGNGR